MSLSWRCMAAASGHGKLNHTRVITHIMGLRECSKDTVTPFEHIAVLTDCLVHLVL